MAHCVWSVPDEVDLLRANGVWIAHCPTCNMNLASGIAPVRRYLSRGIRVGLGTDVAGGHTDSMFRAVTDAIQVSKLYWRHIDSSAKPLTFPESLYLATKGGGAFFGKAGSFEEGYPQAVHHPEAKFNDSILSGGAAAYAYMALRYLSK